MHAAYPTLENLKAALEDAGLSEIAPSDATLEGALNGAIGKWETDADWGPFLAKSTETTRRFTLSGGRRLFLRCGLVAPPSLVTINDVEIELDAGYWLEPANAIEEGKPFTQIDWDSRRASSIHGCVITGRWGYCTELEDQVWRAVLMRAALNVSGELQRRFSDAKTDAQNAAGIIKAKESGPIRVEFQTIGADKVIDLSATFDAWQSAYAGALDGRRMTTP